MAHNDLSPDTLIELNKRLRRVEGQVRGIQNMLEDARDCKEIILQIAAASKALEQVGFRLIAYELGWCLKHPDKAAKNGYCYEDLEEVFMKLS
ncbi:MAG: metal-sensitive transcriptional regulator [Actinobacteria bacterium]|jgi:DNA-binding FrmR family transcriptional regulator|nr:metal-sensitive transcriptional regulator [Actinomycetota bacterium]MCL6105045.1 metal-sensitive transcriptional regulator [Actinomycetota bacterium]